MKRFLTIVLLVVGFSGCGGTTIPYYGVTMNQKLLSNGVSTECNYNPSQAFEGSQKIILLNATITTTTLMSNGEKFTSTCILEPKPPR